MKDPNLIVHGKIENGTLKIGDKLAIMPSGAPAQVLEIFDAKNELVKIAYPGENVQIKIYGIDLKIILKKKNLLNYLQVLKKTSSFSFKFLVDLVVEDFPKKKKRFYVKYILRSLEFGKSLHLIIKTKEFKPIFSIINLYKSAF